MSLDRRHPAELLRDEAGQTSLEWVLLLSLFGLPMIYVCRMLLETLAAHYRFVQLLETLPFP